MAEALVSLIPLSVAMLVLFFFSIPISRRKGKSIVYPVLCLIPFVSIFILFYLANLTDKNVLDRLAELERNARQAGKT